MCAGMSADVHVVFHCCRYIADDDQDVVDDDDEIVLLSTVELRAE